MYETLLMLNYVKEGNHLKIRAKEKRVKDGEKKRRVGIINAWLKTKCYQSFHEVNLSETGLKGVFIYLANKHSEI